MGQLLSKESYKGGSLMKKIRFFLLSLIAVVIFMGVAQAAMKYSIIYETTKIRTDGGKSYFVLIKPVNLKNGRFREDIKEAVRAIAKEKGQDITIDFFSDRKLLDDFYQDQLKSILRFETKAEVRHHVARFHQQSKNGSWLYFFPYMHPSTCDPKTFGKYYEYFMFDPYKAVK
jgi:hypothetical protein